MKKTILLTGIILTLLLSSCQKDSVTKDTALLINKAWFLDNHSVKQILYFGENGNYTYVEMHYYPSENLFIYNDSSWSVSVSAYDWNWSDEKIRTINVFYEQPTYYEGNYRNITKDIDIFDISKDKLIIRDETQNKTYVLNNELYDKIVEYVPDLDKKSLN